jgi:hypothetical protein
VAGAVTLLAAVMAVAPVVTAVHEPSPSSPESASLGGTAFAQSLRPSAPLLFDGFGPSPGSAFEPDPLEVPAPPAPPAPPAFHPDAAGRAPVPPPTSLAPRAAARSVLRSQRLERREARRLAESVVVFTTPAPEPAVVWTVELPAAAVRAKLAELRTVLERHRELESQVLPALEAQMDAQSLERLAEFLNQIGEAKTLSLEVSTPLQRFEPQLRMEALKEARDARRMEFQILLQQLDQLRQSAIPKADWMPSGSI